MTALRLWPLVLGLVGGCITQGSDPPNGGGDPGYGDGWGTGTGGTGGPISYGCSGDASCGTGNVCARDGECLAAADVRIIHVTWTIDGQPADASSCASYPNLDITFTGNGADGYDTFGFAPVPCMEGKFTVDKMPTRFGQVALEPDCQCQTADSSGFDSTGSATLDLSF
ncbi:MAG: hypothetical protein ABI467_08030 [Kofleriaceae bacterium]